MRGTRAVTSSISQDKRKLAIAVSLLLALGFTAIAVINYVSSRTAIRESIVASELPLTSDNIYSEIQKDLLRPVLISSLMAADTFLHDWVNGGEADVSRITRYLHGIRQRYGAVTSFFVSARTRIYYQADGVLKKISPEEPRDAWYFRVSGMSAPYELNVDPDAANKDALTIFINYRVLDYDGRYLGATGVGLTVEAVRDLIGRYQEKYRRSVYFVNKRGVISLFGRGTAAEGRNIRDLEGLGAIAEDILSRGAGSYRYQSRGRTELLNVRFIPELDWYLFVAQSEHDALASARRALYIDIVISVLITAVVLLLTTLTIGRYQRRLENMATTDKLTGLANRQAFDLLVPQALREAAREKTALAAILIDIDRFKQINDRFGHAVGDRAIVEAGQVIRGALRSADFVFRWGGEEYLVIAKNTTAADGMRLAEKIRGAVRAMQITHEGIPVALTISAGVAAYEPQQPIDTWIGRADRALYAAKEEGRDAVRAA